MDIKKITATTGIAISVLSGGLTLDDQTCAMKPIQFKQNAQEIVCMRDNEYEKRFKPALLEKYNGEMPDLDDRFLYIGMLDREIRKAGGIILEDVNSENLWKKLHEALNLIPNE